MYLDREGVLIVGVVALIVSLITTGVALYKTRTDPKHEHSVSCSSCGEGLALAGLAIFIGLMGGTLAILYYVYIPDFFNRWYQMPNPSDKAVELLHYDFFYDTVYVSTASGSIYACSAPSSSMCSSSFGRDRGCTKQLSTPSFNENLYVSDFSPPSNPPGVVVNKITVLPDYSDRECWQKNTLVILDDGSIWRWEEVDGEIVTFYKIYIVIFCIICGTVFSSLILLGRPLWIEVKLVLNKTKG